MSTNGVARAKERRFRAEELVLERTECPCGELVVHSARSPGKTSANEDAAAVLPIDATRVVLAVADGVGGQPDGEQASARALEALAQALDERRGDSLRRSDSLRRGESSSLREAILDGFDRANRAVLALGTGAATTLAVAEIDGRHVRTYHVGDSAILCFGGRGRLKLHTVAHSPTGYAVESGLLAEADAMVHEDRHIVSNVIGDPLMHVGMSSPLELCERDTLVLASDGLFDNLKTDEVVSALRRGPLEAAVRALAGDCRARMEHGGHPDDLTVLAFRPARVKIQP